MDRQQTATLHDLATLCSDIPALLGTTDAGYARSQAERFIEALTGCASTPMTFQTFDPSGQNAQLTAVVHGPLGVVFSKLLALNRSGAAVAVTVNETDLHGRSSKNVVRVRAVFADEDEAFTKQPPITPSLIVRGRKGRRHLYWRVDDLPLDDFGPLQKSIATCFGSDSSVCDLSRAMRLPGFRHWSDASDVIPYVEVMPVGEDDDPDALVARAAAELKAAFNFSSITRATSDPHDVDDGRLPDLATRVRRARAYLESTPGAIEGEHGDEHTFAVACKLVRGFALPSEAASELMMEWNRKCLPPWTEDKLRRKVDVAETSGTEPVGGKLLDFPPRPKLDADSSGERNLVTARDFLAEPDDDYPSYLGEAVLPKGGVCVLAGLTGSRKTWLMLQMAVSIATGNDLFGLLTPAPAKVLLLECESSRTPFRRRLRNMLAGMGIEAPPNLHFLPQDGTIPQIGKPLEECIRKTQAEVVILDTHGYFWDGEENSNSDWKQKVFAPLKEISRNCPWSPAFVLVHHFGKSDSGVGNRSRGATAIENDASAVLYLDRKKESDLSVLRFKKIRDGEELGDIALAFDREKYILVPVETPAGGQELPAQDLRMFDWVAEYARQHGQFSPKDVTAKIIEAFGVSKEVARRVPVKATAAGRLKGITKGLYGPAHG